MYRIRIISIVFFLICIGTIYAQDIEVKKFEPLEKDQTAVTSPRKDINGTACGLVKVALKEPGAEFEGNVMGDVQFTGSEYLVYMPNGSKRLGIKHPDYLPITIVFADYGTKKVASSTTYELKVKANKKKAKVDNSKKGMAVFNIKPSNAMLLIDGQIADGSGGAYTLSLPYGTHYYTVKLKDFSINNQMVQVDKNAKSINVDLAEYFAKLNVLCKEKDAEIKLNGEFQGEGTWQGILCPGNYVVEVFKDGYHSQTKTILLSDNDSVVCDFPAMKMIAGSLNVVYKPNDCVVCLDGKVIGKTPIMLNNIPVGTHKLEVGKELFKPASRIVDIKEFNTYLAEGLLEETHLKKILDCANNEGGVYEDVDYVNAQKALGDYYRTGKGVCTINFDYYKISESDSCHDKRNIDKAIEWYKKAENESLKELCLCYIHKQDYEKSFLYVKKMLEDHRFYSFQDITYYLCGWHYYFGRGVSKNEQEAWSWFNKIKIGGRYEGLSTKEFLREYHVFQDLNIEPIK